MWQLAKLGQASRGKFKMNMSLTEFHLVPNYGSSIVTVA